MWQANVFTIFPMAFPGTLGVSLIGKALEQQRWCLNLIDLKQFPVKSDRIDDKPYGGGAEYHFQAEDSGLYPGSAERKVKPAEKYHFRIPLSHCGSGQRGDAGPDRGDAEGEGIPCRREKRKSVTGGDTVSGGMV